MTPEDTDRALHRIVDFLRQVGIEVEACELSEPTFLPGIAIESGRLRFDARKLEHPGDLLHEAGHLAVVPEERRRKLCDRVADDGIEMAAIAWSYAACVQLGLPVELLFHPSGYKGESAWLIDHFRNEPSLGVPVLEWRGMTRASDYPKMTRWLARA